MFSSYQAIEERRVRRPGPTTHGHALLMQTEFCQMACFSSSGDVSGSAVWILILPLHTAIILFYGMIDNQDRHMQGDANSCNLKESPFPGSRPYPFHRLKPFNQPI